MQPKQTKACASPASMDSTSTADMASMAPDFSMVVEGAIWVCSVKVEVVAAHSEGGQTTVILASC